MADNLPTQQGRPKHRLGFYGQRFRQYFHEFSGQQRIFLLVQISIFVWAWFLWRHLPNPGWAVAILAGVAAVMSVHGEMRGWQKAIWMMLIGCLLIIELRSISNDRAESDKRALAERQTQDLAFKGVRDAQDADFKVTAGALSNAIDGIQSTLKAADVTLIQTRPHAAIRFDRIEFAGTKPSEIKAKTPYGFNYYYVNRGAQTATGITGLVQIYVAQADNKEVQIQLSRQFEEAWNLGTLRQKSPSILVPDTPVFGSIERTFTDEEILSLSPKGTIYYLLRFEYSDETGRWRTDVCESLQRSSATNINTNVFHTCSVFQRFRYPAKRH